MAMGIVEVMNTMTDSTDSFELSLSSNFKILNSISSTFNVTVTTPSDGSIYANSSDVGIAKVTVTGKVVKITSAGYGSAIISIGQEAGTGDYASLTPPVINFFLIVQR